MGDVYLAEQLEPIQRKVALKVVKRGLDTREVLARFEVERQTLALMDHPAIATVLDAGSTEAEALLRDGVRAGGADHALVRPAPPPIGERLKLFVEVCDGIQHAHQKGSSTATSSPPTSSSPETPPPRAQESSTSASRRR